MNTDRLDAVMSELSGMDAENPFWDGPQVPPATDVDVDDEELRSPSPPLLKFRRAPVSPPPSHRETQTQTVVPPPTTPKAAFAPSSSTKKGKLQPVRDSPNNPFLEDSPASIMGEPVEPRTPTKHVEKPTLSYVLCVPLHISI